MKENTREETDYNKLINMANQANTMLFCCHIYLILMFAFNHIWLMVGINIVSLCIYGGNYFWSGKNLRAYFISAYVEILMHMIISVIAVGWDCGFQIYIFALVLIIYYGDYVFKKELDHKINLHPRIVSVTVIALYPVLYLLSHFVPSLYTIGKAEIRYVFFIVNALFVLIFFVVYVDFFLKIVLQTEKRLMDAAGKDELTGMNNRRTMQDLMKRLTEGRKQPSIAVAILDIDDFKLVNDTYGHNAGDLVLKRVAAHILSQDTEETVSCRWGGEEFLILSKGENAFPHLVSKIEEILRKVREDTYDYEDMDIRLTMSGGISARRDNERIEHTISRADQHLYQAKKNGKNQYIKE